MSPDVCLQIIDKQENRDKCDYCFLHLETGIKENEPSQPNINVNVVKLVF